MCQLSFKRHRFPADIIRHSVWLYARFTLSFRDVEEMLAERGIDVSYETIRRWVLKFGSVIAANLRRGIVTLTGASHTLANSEPRSGRDAGALPNLERCGSKFLEHRSFELWRSLTRA